MDGGIQKGVTIDRGRCYWQWESWVWQGIPNRLSKSARSSIGTRSTNSSAVIEVKTQQEIKLKFLQIRTLQKHFNGINEHFPHWKLSQFFTSPARHDGKNRKSPNNVCRWTTPEGRNNMQTEREKIIKDYAINPSRKKASSFQIF